MNSNQNLWSKARLSIGKLSSLLMVIVVCLSVSGFQCGFGGGDSNTSKDGLGWRVWIRTEPCPGRFDWLSVAKEQPGGGTTKGMGTFWLYDYFLPRQGAGCTDQEPFGCTLAEATALMETLRSHPKFLDFCCKEYSVWRNELTQKKTIVVGKFGKAPNPWIFEAGPMCCEEAEALSGLTGACSGSEGGKTGYIGCFKDTPAFDLDGFLERSRSNTPERCVETCRAKGFAFAAVQYGESCLCGNSYGKYGAASNCDYKCTGDSSKICGGYNANSVYGTGVSVGGKDGNKIDDGVITNKTPAQTPTIMQTPPTGGRWTLVSVTAIPETPAQGYSYNAQSSSASYLVYNGDKHNFQWTKPPQQIDANGFTVSLSVQCQPIPKSRCASLIGVAGEGIDSDTPGGERKAEASGENGAGGSGQKSVTFKPTGNSNELEVRVELMWGAVKFIYKYQRAE